MGKNKNVNKRRKLYKKQSGLCALCGQRMPKVTKNVPARKVELNPRFPTLDHINRVRDGGGMSLTNLQLAHNECNRKRNRKAEYYLIKGETSMGYMRHHAIVVASWSDDLLKKAHEVAEGSFPWVSEIAENSLGIGSFFVPPDGSKEGWNESDLGDDRRNGFTKWLDAQRYDDGSTSLDWVEIQFGDDNKKTEIVSHSDQ